MDKSRPGDIILFKFDNRYWYARPWAHLISRILGSRYTHAGIVVDTSHGGIIVEAYYPTVRKILLQNSFCADQYTWETWRPKRVPEKTMAKAVVAAGSYIARPYDLKGLLAITKEFILSGILGVDIRRDTNLLNHNNKYFCSELVDQCYKNAGFVLDGRFTIGAMAPSDFANEERFELIETSQDSQ